MSEYAKQVPVNVTSVEFNVGGVMKKVNSPKTASQLNREVGVTVEATSVPRQGIRKEPISKRIFAPGDADAAYYEPFIEELNRRHGDILRQAMADVRREVAREIFEEIERKSVALSVMNSSCCGLGIDSKSWQSLKSKYLESK